MPYTLEVCVDSTASALAAMQGGAHRLELCADLVIGGTTPSLALLQQVKAETGLPVRALLRPRFGDFCYDRWELAQMAQSAARLVEAGADGIGDKIRVSLTEAPENEIPVAQLLVEHFADRPGEFEVLHPERYFPTEYRRRSKVTVPVVHTEPLEGFRVLEALSGNPTAELRAAILNLDIPDEPVVVKRRYEERSLETLAVKAAADLGPLLLDGLADGIWIDAPGFAESEIRDIELMILQAARVRFSHTEYIACPSCGRTLYDIEKALADIKARTSHLKNLRIGVMGCIVNGPGEMADADYGYVGAAPGRITLYKGRTVVERNIPQEEALDRLVELIRDNGDWVEP